MAEPQKIQKLKTPQKQPGVSQSIPVQFYRHYVPPAPVIKPKGEGDSLPDLELEAVVESEPISIGGTVNTSNSKTSNTTNNSNTTTTNESNTTSMSRSMSGKYSASLPVHKMMMNSNVNYAAIKLEQSKTEQKDTNESDKNSNTDKKKKKKKRKNQR